MGLACLWCLCFFCAGEVVFGGSCGGLGFRGLVKTRPQVISVPSSAMKAVAQGPPITSPSGAL